MQLENFIVTSQELGKGSYGTVYLGYDKRDRSKRLAVKQILKSRIKTEDKQWRRELKILTTIRDQNIVNFCKYITTQKVHYFFFQFCQEDLAKYLIRKGGILSQAEAFSFFKQIVNGFKVLHQNNVIHRDIKPDNILIHMGVAKITDFGFGKIVDDVDESLENTFLGTAMYMAPQILANQKYNCKCDVWSLGVTLFQMLYGRLPFSGENKQALLDNIRKNKLEFPKDISRSEEIQKLLQSMLVVDQENRISWNDLFLHNLLAQNQRITTQLKQLTESNLEQMQKTLRLNQYYIGKNKVLGQDYVELFNKDSPPLDKKDSVKLQSNGDIESDINCQELKLKEEAITEKVNNYLKFRRNVLVYVNFILNTKLFQIMINNEILMTAQYLLYKYLVYNYEVLLDIFSKKRVLDRFQKQWKVYQGSILYWKTRKAIKTDKDYLEPMLKQMKLKLKMKLNVVLSHLSQQDLKELDQNQQQYQTVKQFNYEFYNQILDKSKLYLNKENSALLDMIREPLKSFPESTDFNQLYERRSNFETFQ